ncbi:MAG: Gfo/Idh/MocA family oxidoreductase [Rubrobacteraceae bacterium]
MTEKTTDRAAREIGVGLVGYKFMGRAHSNACRQVARFFDMDPKLRMRAICGRDEEAVRETANALSWEGYETDYGRMIERDDIALVDISSSGDTHHEFAIAAVERSVESREWARPDVYESKRELT